MSLATPVPDPASPIAPMRVLHTESSSGLGGQELRILDECAGLTARGHRVAVACAPDSQLAQESPRRGVETIPIPIGKRNVEAMKALVATLKSFQPHVINTHSSTDSWLATLATRFINPAIPLVRTRHISSPVKGGRVSRWLYRQTAAIVTTSQDIRHHMIEVVQADPDKVFAIPTGVDLTRFRPGNRDDACRSLGLDPDRRYVSLIAVLRFQKGHRDLIDAFAALDADRFADTDLLLVGAGPQEPALRDKIESAGLGGRVILLGHRSPIEPWFHATDLFVLPSYAEGVPQALMQAMACGLPSIVTAIPSLLETVTPDEDALLLDVPGNVPALTALLTRMLDQPTLRARLGSAAHRNAERFSQAHMLVSMEKIFARAAATRKKVYR
jgi:glycosyltransferase involved in cell wall biosynthesis